MLRRTIILCVTFNDDGIAWGIFDIDSHNNTKDSDRDDRCGVLRESRRKANEEVVSFVTPEDYWLYPIRDVTRRIYREFHDENGKRIAQMMQGDMTHFVALNKKTFGEGAERFAFRFYEVGQDGKTVVGQPHVAKERKFVRSSSVLSVERSS